MAVALNRLINIEDFAEQTVRDVIRDVFQHEVARRPGFPTGHEHRRNWETAMSILALREGGALRPDAQVLCIGVETATRFWLTNHVGRVWAINLDTDNPASTFGPGSRSPAPGPNGDVWPGSWNPRRMVTQDMDVRHLAYEDGSFDAVVLSVAGTPVRSVQQLEQLMDEAHRVLKPGGSLSISADFALVGEPDLEGHRPMMFTRESIQRLLVGDREWAEVAPMDFTVSEATKATEIDYEAVRLERQDVTVMDEETDAGGANDASVYPYCVLRVGPDLFTSMHLALRKPDPNAAPVTVAPAGSELVVAGPRDDIAALARHLGDALVVVDAGCRWGFRREWEDLGEHVRLIGFDPDAEECRRLEEVYGGRQVDARFVPVALGSKRGRSSFREFADPAVRSLYSHDPRWLYSMALPREGDTLQGEADIDLETLDEWCVDHDVDRVDAMKLDVQGHELEVLRGATSSLANARIVEAEVWLNPVVTGAPLHGEIDAFLRERGFSLWRLDDQTHYPVVDSEGAPGSVQRIDPFGHGQIEVHLPPGFLCWANAHYVRKEIFEVDVRLPWEVRLRDALLMNALCFHDLTLLSLRRLLVADPPVQLAEEVRAVLAASPGLSAHTDAPAVDHTSAPEQAAGDTAALTTEKAVARRRSPMRLLRAAARVPYHPVVWRLDRNAAHARRQAEALEGRLGTVEQQLAVVSALLDDVRIRQEQEDAASRVVVRELRRISRSQYEVRRDMQEARRLSELWQEAIVEWTALISRAVGEDRDASEAGHSD